MNVWVKQQPEATTETTCEGLGAMPQSIVYQCAYSHQPSLKVSSPTLVVHVVVCMHLYILHEILPECLWTAGRSWVLQCL